MKGYSDLASLTEDERIQRIGEAVTAGNKVAVVLEADQAKINRYVSKVTTQFERAELIASDAGPIAGTVSLYFGPKPEPAPE